MRKFLKVHFQRILSLFALLVLCVAMVLGGQMTAPVAYAETGGANKYDDTYVLDDLSTAMVGDKPFNLNDYPKNPYGEIQAVTLMEYCYSFYGNSQGNYALYLYIYNPAMLSIATTSASNMVEIATDFYYKGENGKEGEPQSYSKFRLQFCSMSTGDYEKLFYKFRVIDENNEILNAVREYEEEFGGVRPYYVSSVEFVAEGSTKIEDYYLGKIYRYSGYAEGYGNSDDFPIDCDVEDFQDYLDLEVKSTHYRPSGASIEGTGVQDELDSIYFAIPNDTIEKFGEIDAVHLEWYEYLTNRIFVTGNSEVFNALQPYIGKDISELSDYSTEYMGWSRTVKYGFAIGHTQRGPNDQYPVVSSGYNLTGVVWDNGEDSIITKLPFLFSSGGEDVYDFQMSRETFEEYVKWYSENVNTDKSILGKYSSDLFIEGADADRTAGYNERWVKASDEYSLESYVLDTAWWHFWGETYDDQSDEYEGIKAIHKVDPHTDFAVGDIPTICDNLYINEGDYEVFKAYVDEATEQDKTVYLLRFAVTDYHSTEVENVGSYDTFGVPFPDWLDDNAYMAQQTAFLNLDVIDVTFLKDGVYTTLAAVSDPIDILNPTSPPVNVPDDGLNLLQIILLVLALIVLLVILMPILPYIIKAVVWIIMLPFKAIAAIVKGIQKAARKKPKTAASSPTKAVKAPQPKTVYVKSDKPKQSKEKQNK